jgi:hypothetical protein
VLSDAGLPAGEARFTSLALLIDAPRARFAIRVNSAKADRVALVIAETRGGQFHPNSHFVDALSAQLAAAGYNVIGLDEMGVQVPADPTPANMALAVAGKADTLVYGVVKAELDSKVAAGLVFSKATAQLVVVEVATRKVKRETKPTTRSPGRDPQSAFDRSLAALAKQVSASLTGVLSAPEPTHP